MPMLSKQPLNKQPKMSDPKREAHAPSNKYYMHDPLIQQSETDPLVHSLLFKHKCSHQFLTLSNIIIILLSTGFN